MLAARHLLHGHKPEVYPLKTENETGSGLGKSRHDREWGLGKGMMCLGKLVGVEREVGFKIMKSTSIIKGIYVSKIDKAREQHII